MASIGYLWRNRARFSPASARFYKAWAKRVHALPSLLQRNYRRSKLTGKGATIHETAEIGEVTVQGHKKHLHIGRLSFLGRVMIALHDDVIIGEKVCINDGVEILTASHDIADPEWKHVKAKIVIEDYAWIGTGALLLPGVTIGKGAVVGARAVVTKSVPPGVVVAGNPAKPLQRKRSEELVYDPCEFLAANRAWLKG
ncbi:acyltransferase [Panacibacter sp. DH6]|uniref:Acyltransferase n=1 Tax=Panacibacter microcysteis TaxID=2793269 RepID=A0A931GY08_9BACT|nr:acyltransferase [Panacibacter microcysteis]MBG9377069.1 acyltransferase [Panacibacter microcysteis]